MKINRIRKIQELLQEKPSLTIDHLCEVFQVSKNTIRRDIAELQKTGCIKKVYGGIVLNEQPAQEEENHPHSWAAEDPHLKNNITKNIGTYYTSKFNYKNATEYDSSL